MVFNFHHSQPALHRSQLTSWKDLIFRWKNWTFREANLLRAMEDCQQKRLTDIPVGSGVLGEGTVLPFLQPQLVFPSY